MKPYKPEFRLSRVFADGSSTEPEIVPVTGLTLDCKMDRRVLFRAGIFGAGIVGAAAVGMMMGCQSENSTHPANVEPSPTPNPSSTPIYAEPVYGFTTPTPTPNPTPKIVVPHHRPGGTTSGTAPCGGPIPPGAICTCNCVAY